jgi:hypothetical protein
MRESSLGYIQKRRGIVEHLEDGRMSFADVGFHDILVSLADPGTGFVWSSAAQLALRLNKTRKLMQYYLCRLERKGYIRRFPVPRSHERYAILINKFQCTLLPQKGKVLNAIKTSDWRVPVYEPLSTALSTALSRHTNRNARAETLENLEKNTKVKTRPPTPRPPSEQQRNVEARNQRLQRETAAAAEAQVGRGPELPGSPQVCCLECRDLLTRTNLSAVCRGKAPGDRRATARAFHRFFTVWQKIS